MNNNAANHSEELEIILANGRVIDPQSHVDEITQVGITGGKIAAVGEKLSPGSKTRVLDCKGLYVVPGLIDLHVHAFCSEKQGLGLDPDFIMGRSGVTTMLDAGSAGSQNWDEMQGRIRKSKARVLALIHLCKNGLEAFPGGELLDPGMADLYGAENVIRQNSDLVKGAKIRAGTHIIGSGEQGVSLLDKAIEAARNTGTFVMVHIGNTVISIPKLVQKLNPGDIITHCYKGGLYSDLILDSNGRVYPEIMEAAKAGIIFDVGHGSGSFDWDVAERAIDQGLVAATISTDLHQISIKEAVFDLPTTMTKFKLLGFKIQEIVEKCTAVPSRILGMEGRIGCLQAGAEADVTLLKWYDGEYKLYDSYGKCRKSDGCFKVAGVIKAGKIYGTLEGEV